MNLELNKKQFRRLMDLVYIGCPVWRSSIRGKSSPPAPL